MNKINCTRVIFLFMIVLLLLAACGRGSPVISTPLADPSLTATSLPTNTFTSVPIPTDTASPTFTLTATLEPTQQAGYDTAVAAAHTEAVASRQAYENELTKAARFPAACDEITAEDISPDGKWIATSCGYKRNQTLVVQNQEGTKWILQFKDFLSPDTSDDMIGLLSVEAWSPDGAYLYFAPHLGYDGGGDECFPYHRGRYGLFRLNVSTGTWVTLIPATDSFPGYGVEFSPTGRRYATDANGVIITDLNTGEATTLDVSGVVEGLSWSPDGLHLAYSLASCHDYLVASSSAYIWDASTNQAQQVLRIDDGLLLEPESWMDNSTLRITGKKYVGGNPRYTVYIYNLAQQSVVFSGTATPYP